ncbi:carbohydrate-binding protein [Krasilnikovia sp. M28-CT-15]|uniref:carbohydrate-binding protein n=1 Tax=Krasilnikovia sp. M28-CT-15 TaxID=3373540 RepID=UPI0038778646
MHRAAHAGRTFLRRRRVLLALAVVGAGLATALYLPTRNDTASAHENRAGRITVCERRDGRYVWRWTSAEGRTFRDRDCRRTWTARPADEEWFPTASPSGPTTEPTPTSPSPSVSEDPSTDPTPTETATTEPTPTEPTPTEPPAPEPTTTTLEPVKQSDSPSATPTKVNAPKWKVRTDYKAGDLVSFAGKVYRVKEAHTALPGWEPSKLKELFEPVG